MKQLVLGLNGPIGIGKTWLTKQAVEKYGLNHCGIIRSTEVARKHVESMYGVTDKTYEEFRDSKHDLSDEYAEPGMTGREIVIKFIETHREKDPYFISKTMCESLRWSTQEFVILDTVGNSEENLYIENWVATQNKHSARIHRTYMLFGIGTQGYKPGQQFSDNDGSRSCAISKRASHFCKDSNEALRTIHTIVLLHLNLEYHNA